MIRQFLDKPLTKLVLGIVLVLVLALGAFIIFGDGDQDSTVSLLIFDNAWTTTLFSFVVFGAFAGLLAIGVSFFPKRISVEGVKNWEVVCAKGQAIYVRNALLFIALPLISITCLVFLGDRNAIEIPYSEYIRNLVVLCLVTIGLTVFAAVSLWNDQEKRYAVRNMQDKSRPGK